MIPRLAYNLVSRADQPPVREILQNVVAMLWPTMNPDGQQLIGEWHAQNLGTIYEQSGLPRLYQEYVGHDNNRDAYMLNMIESRLMEHFWRRWEPHIIYVHHQTAPFPARIWLPPFSEPVGLEAPALVAREVNMIGMAIAKGLEERGLVGAIHMGTSFDAWYPGYIDYAPVFKNIPAFWTETAGNMACARQYTIEDFPQNFRDLRPMSLYSSPWPPGWWRLGDAVTYNETASLPVLEYAARYRESLLYNRYQAGRDQIARGKKDPPYAYVIPQKQRDPVAPVELLHRLAFAGVRVWQLTEPVALDDTTYPAGTWLIPTDQEFAALARELLDIQKYPDLRQYPGGPPMRPYDAAGWTLPLQMGIRWSALSSPLTGEARTRMKLLGPPPDPKVELSPYNASASGDAARFAMEQFRLPVRNAVEDLKSEEFFLRGSIVEVVVDPTHPVMAGMPKKAAVFVDGSPVFETLEGFRGTVLARYPETGSPLLSGYLIGEKFLHGKAAALDVEFGEGHVVLLGFRPQWRCQPFGTFRVVFNAALYLK